MWSIRIRSAKLGAQHIKIEGQATLSELKQLISTQTQIPSYQLKLLVGFPPKEVLGAESNTIQQIGINNNDTITVEQNQNAKPVETTLIAESIVDLTLNEKDEVPIPGNIPEDFGNMKRIVIDSDNSCLFNSLGFVLEGRNRNIALKLREIVSKTVLSDRHNWSEGFLGKPNEEYSKWILKSESWGGAIELSILSKYYQCEIAAFDIQQVKMYLYGENQNYKQRVLLLYDGIHYDAMAFTFDDSAPEEALITVFNPTDPFVVAKALEVVEEAHSKRQFTDLGNFDLRCLVCQQGLIGQKGALEHAKATGHTNFAQYK